ncbi:MAG: TolB family protein, partial [bacterium]
MKKNIHYLSTTLVAIMLFLFTHSATTRASIIEIDDPGTRKKSVIEGNHITAIIPKDAAEILRPRVSRLDEIFDFLCQEADYTPRKKLVVNLSDEFDLLNGWASSLPRPVVELNLSPGSYGGFFFASDRRLEFIAIHEFTHILNMEPNYKFRGFLEKIFGRVIPNDPISLLILYLSTPSQMTMPRFWLEGMAQWAETKYSPRESIWGGRGRDTYTHMIWRLDAAEGKIPQVDDWRLSYIHWPYGSRSYHYGLAYTRYLDGAYGDRASIWKLALSQAENWPFSFQGGVHRLLHKNHGALIKEARSALLREQEEILQKLRSVPLTPVQRRTPEDYIFGAPAWTSDGHLFACAYDPFASRQRYVSIDKDGKLTVSPLPAHEITAVRRSPGGSLVTSNLVKTLKNRLRSRISIIKPSGEITKLRLRLAQPDLAEGMFHDADGLVALHFTAGGRQELCLYRLDDKNLECLATLPSEGTPWEPIFRPGNDGPPREIAWVESYENKTELILAPIEDLSKRQKLLSLKGRIIHPCWSSDGSELFYCSDVTGVSNAYRLNVSPEGIPLSISPITHTIGGVLACVPSPDGKEFAIIDHDRRGPFIARIPNNTNKDTGRLPEIKISWPAPVKDNRPVDTADTFIDPPKKNNYPTLHEYSYNGLSHLEFQYWTPTTMVTDTGGIGLQIAFGDPIWNHRIIAGIGSGYETDKAVGQAYYSYFGLARTTVLLTGYGLESTFTERVTSSFGELYNYTEYITGGTVSLGFELSG